MRTTLQAQAVQQARHRRLVQYLRPALILLTFSFVFFFHAAPQAHAAVVDPPLCAGQTWDSWTVLATSPLQDQQGRQVGAVKLWWKLDQDIIC